MKVILLSSVPKVGAVNEIIDVSDGYAQNYLIPQGLAEAATDRNVAELSKKVEENKARDAERQKELESMLAKANGATLAIARDANEQGTLFSAVSASDIAEVLEAEKGVAITETYVLLDTPLKEIGTYSVELGTNGTKAKVTVEIQNTTEEAEVVEG